MLTENKLDDDVPRIFRVITKEKVSLSVDEEFQWEKRFPEDAADEHHGFRRYGIPERKRHAASMLERVPATYLRRIQAEIEIGDYDTLTMLSACHGLEHGSKEFAAKYFEARLASFSRSPRSCISIKPWTSRSEFEQFDLIIDENWTRRI